MLKKIKYKNSVQIIVNQNIEELSDWIILKWNANCVEKNSQKINMQKEFIVEENVDSVSFLLQWLDLFVIQILWSLGAIWSCFT
jgi:hypothetical protein